VETWRKEEWEEHHRRSVQKGGASERLMGTEGEEGGEGGRREEGVV